MWPYIACLVAGCLIGAAVSSSASFHAIRSRTHRIGALDEKRYSILESIPDGFFIIDLEWRFTHINERAEKMLQAFGVPLIGARIEDVLDPLASELVPEMREVRRTGQPLDRIQHFRASNSWIEIRIQPAHDELLVYLRDITERKKIELLSRESERRVRLLLAQLPAVLWTVDLNASITSISGAALSNRGWNAADALGSAYSSLFTDPEQRGQCTRALHRALSGEAVRHETYQNGRWTQNDIEPLRDEDGIVIGAVGVSLDVTEVRQTANRFAEMARRDTDDQVAQPVGT